jgi:GNAT superfamily N-acetyltransferase
MPPVEIRVASISEAATVADILMDAAQWLAESGKAMWQMNELDANAIAGDVAQGAFFLAWVAGEAAGTVRFQLEDPLFWPDAPSSEAAYVHRLAVRRRFAGSGVSTALLTWAADRARASGRRVLRLDCTASRVKLRALYERFGFRYHSDREVGPYVVARYEYFL